MPLGPLEYDYPSAALHCQHNLGGKRSITSFSFFYPDIVCLDSCLAECILDASLYDIMLICISAYVCVVSSCAFYVLLNLSFPYFQSNVV